MIYDPAHPPEDDTPGDPDMRAELVAEGSPRLLLVFKRRLTAQAIENLRAARERAWTGEDALPIAIEEDPEVFQLRDGHLERLR